METKDIVVYVLAGTGAVTGTGGIVDEVREENLEPRIAVLETEVLHAKEDTKEIKEGVKDNSRKLDELKDLIREGR